MSRIGLIDYGMGNLHSVQRAFERLGAEIIPIHGAASMEDCEALVLPGVGSFDPAMERLHHGQLVDAIQASCADGRPLLGICLGLQLLFEGSDEGTSRGLGLLNGQVRALPRVPHHPIPHMGWAPLLPGTASPLLSTENHDAWVYFVHSYAAAPENQDSVTAWVDWAGMPVTAAIWQDNIAACQFHPEKSGPVGVAMLQRWLDWVADR